MSKKYATVTQIVAIHAELERVLIKHSDGSVSYSEGHSDATVAHGYADLSPYHVGRIRREAFGELSKVKTRPVDDRIARLEAKVSFLYSKLGIAEEYKD